MQNIQHIFFDLDHTLWDFETNSNLAFKHIFKENNITVSSDEFLKYYEEINQKYWKLYREDKVSRKVLRYKRLKETFDVVNYTISDWLINKLSEDYLYTLPNYNFLFEGVHETLQYLQKKYTLHIITNGFNEVQNHKLKKSKLQQYFATITTSEKAESKKPHTKIFKYALQEAKAVSEKSIMIGDNLEADVLGAKQAGLQAIYFNPEKKETPNKIIQITNLIQLKKIL